MHRPVVFVSYSHKDEKEQQHLLSHLGVLHKAGLLEVWSDDNIGAGVNWQTEISRAIEKSKVAVLLITANFLTSEFILSQEVPVLLTHREHKGLAVFPVIAKACAWERVDWLAGMNVRPKNGKPIWGINSLDVDEVLASIVGEIGDIIQGDLSDGSLDALLNPTGPVTRHRSRIKLTEKTADQNRLVCESNEPIIKIGRAPNNILHIPDPEVSWEHGQIIMMRASYYYYHLSTKKTSVLRRRGEEYLLQHGGVEKIMLQNADRLTIGNKTFIIEFDLINEDKEYVTTT